MYCGDETGSFIGDVGSHSSRFGYGGEDCPKYVVPSYVLFEEDKDAASPGDTVMHEQDREGTRFPIRRRRGRRSLSSRTTVLSSCYDARRIRGGTVRTPLRTVQEPPSSSDSQLHQQPLTDPTLYLQQGDSIHDLDAVEELWQSAFDTLQVRDRYKHTNHPRAYSSTSSSTSRSNNNNTTTIAASGVTSSTVRSTSTGDDKCLHPILVVAPGCTHRVGVSSSTSTSTVATNTDEPMPLSSSSMTIHNHDLRHRTSQLIELTERFMEGPLQATALFVAPTPMLQAFSHGRQTALVVDLGAGGCRVTPVVDGLLLRQAQRRNGRGGDWLSNVQWKAMLEQLREQQQQHSTVEILPRYQIRGNKNAGPSVEQGDGDNEGHHTTINGQGRGIFHRWAMNDLMYEFRTSGHVQLPLLANYIASVPFLYQDHNHADNMAVDPSPTTKPTPPVSGTEGTYTLPDGTVIDLTTRIGKDLCRVTELLFTDQLPFVPPDYALNNCILQEHASLTDLSLPRLVHASLSAVGDVDTRKDLASCILLTGGGSLLFPSQALEQRLSYAVSTLVSSAYKTKVIASRYSIERSCSAWIGGSILSSLGSFQQLWLSRTEYEEYGAALAVQRFP